MNPRRRARRRFVRIGNGISRNRLRRRRGTRQVYQDVWF